MRKWRTSPSEPKFFSNFNMTEAAEMVSALRRTHPEQRLETFAIVMKLLVEGRIDDGTRDV